MRAVCDRCDTRIPPGAYFCPQCGIAVGAGPEYPELSRPTPIQITLTQVQEGGGWVYPERRRKKSSVVACIALVAVLFVLVKAALAPSQTPAPTPPPVATAIR